VMFEIHHFHLVIGPYCRLLARTLSGRPGGGLRMSESRS
jgi:hypothetical protein